MINIIIHFYFVFIFLVSPAFADFVGDIHVVDGDTLHVDDVTVRIHGIDAPETDQTCNDAQGRNWPCGVFVTEEIRRRFEGETATCYLIELDRYGRTVAKCFVGGRDVGEQIVEDGLAHAYRQYSMDYDRAEKSAQVLKLGVWAGTMQSPAAFRRDQRSAILAVNPPLTPTDANCFIKGNISEYGQIYHMPRNRDYNRTRINENRGERWFCNEAEAQAAGWRAARN